MIKSIRLTNFFSFQDEVVDLSSQANILVGINGSGKSNLIKAISLLKLGVEGNSDDSALRELIINKWGGFDNIYCKAKNVGLFKDSIRIEYKLDGNILSKFSSGIVTYTEDIIYIITIIKKRATDNYYIKEELKPETGGNIYLDFINGQGKVLEKQEEDIFEIIDYVEIDSFNSQELALSKISEFDTDRYLPLVTIKKAIKDIAVYNYFDTTANSKLRSAMSATSGINKLLPDGSNLPQVLNTIKIKNKPYYRIIQNKLQDVNEMFGGFDFNILGGGQFELMLDETKLNSSIHITHVSDGTLRYLCLLAILYNPNRGVFVCIDEPEVGLHPDMIYNISNSISEASEETTFLIASHSENVLNGFKIENIRIFEKDELNSTKVNMYTEKNFEGWYEEFSPGTMWRKGDIGGTRW